MDEKGASSVNKKEKNSFLDDDIGNDFLTSWKSMSVTKDDAMDFGFDSVSSGKNKAFNFDKLDMDFGLDGGFDKLSSFKVDMADFDLSSPSKKGAKANEKSENKSSSEKPDGKKIKFNFFDFNEMDNFDFESSMVKVGTAPIKNKDDKMDVFSDASDQQSSKIQLNDGIGDFDDIMATKLPASKGVVTSDVETLLSGPGHRIAKEKDREKTILSEDPISTHSGRSSPEKARNNSVEATDQTILSKKAISMDTCSQHARFDFSGPSLVGVVSDRQTRNTCLGTEVHATPGQKENANSKIVGVSASNETLPLKNPSPANNISGSSSIRKNVLGTDTSTETVDGNVSAPGDLGLTENPISSVSRKASNDIKDDEGNQNFTTELPSVLLCSESVVVDKVTLLDHNESGSLNVKGEASENPECQAALLEKKSHSSNCESMASTNKSLETETENSVIYNEPQAGIKSGDNLESVARGLFEGENMLVAGANNVKYQNNLRDRSSSDVLPNEHKLVRPSQFLGEEVANNKPVLSSSDENVTSQTPTVNHVTSDVLRKESKLVVTSQSCGEEEMKKNPTLSTRDNSVINQIPTGLMEKQNPTSVNPKRLFFSMESMRNAKIKSVERNNAPVVVSPKKISVEGNKVSFVGSPKKISVEGNKVSFVGSPKKMPELSILKTSMSKGADEDSDSTSLRCTSSLQNPKPDMEKLYTAASETAHPFKIAEKKSPLKLSFKRKAFELPSSDLLCLKPLKRVSSPKENRDFQEVTRQAIEDKLSREGKNLKLLNCLSKTLSVSRDVKEPMKRVDVEESLNGAGVEKVCVHEKVNNAQNNLDIVPMMTVVESRQEVSVMELELSLTIKDDGSVEKAEAYAKELEDICNMLRKKHEEAKEILVRALVNNNNLLMLNHPIYEEKICKVQKFAAEVMSKELKT